MFVDDVDMNNFPSYFDVKVHNHFRSKERLVNIMHMIAMKNNFEFKVDRSNKSRLYFSCVNDGCTWDLKAATLNKKSNFWKITSYVNIHTCVKDIMTNNHKQATCSIVADCIKSWHVDEATIEKLCPNDIISRMRNHHGVDISYFKAWKGRDLALDSIRGSAEDSYALLPRIGAALKETNPSTFIISIFFLLQYSNFSC